MHERRRVDAEIRDEAGEPALLDRTPNDVENRRSGNEQQHQGGADEQPEIGGTGRDDFHGLVHFVDAFAPSSPRWSGLVNDARGGAWPNRPACGCQSMMLTRTLLR